MFFFHVTKPHDGTFFHCFWNGEDCLLMGTVHGMVMARQRCLDYPMKSIFFLRWCFVKCHVPNASPCRERKSSLTQNRTGRIQFGALLLRAKYTRFGDARSRIEKNSNHKIILRTKTPKKADAFKKIRNSIVDGQPYPIGSSKRADNISTSIVVIVKGQLLEHVTQSKYCTYSSFIQINTVILLLASTTISISSSPTNY